MSRRSWIVPVLAVSAVVSVHADAGRWWSHVKFLADDSMRGRETGSPEHRRAAEYVAARFKDAGLEPAGTDGYFQPVRLKTRKIDEGRSSLALVHGATVEALTLGEDANFSMRVEPAPSVDAPLVFVAHGLRIPERHIDELAGLDLTGAVAVYLNTMPATLPGPLQAHFGSAAERWQMLKAAGAIGAITLANPRAVETPWARSTLSRLLPAMTLADESLDETSGQQVAVTWNPAHADKLFAGSGHTFEELLADIQNGNPLPRFAMPSRIKATVAVEHSDVESQNVAGILRGADPERRNEYVVVSAHLDHVGVGQPVNGDSIYNGAMDNASGVAAMLEVATELHEAGTRPARSILFLAVTAEEKGELGSKYFAAHPTVPVSSIVADVNTDMFLPLFPLKELMVLGLDESDLGRDVRAVAEELKLKVQADPEPERSRFTRSDQYSFIRAGIPALAMKVGYELNTPEDAIARKWTTDRYHAPSDDLNQPVDLSAADGYVTVVRMLAVRVANRPDRPKWNDASFFKRFARTN